MIDDIITNIEIHMDIGEFKICYILWGNNYSNHHQHAFFYFEEGKYVGMKCIMECWREPTYFTI